MQRTVVIDIELHASAPLLLMKVNTNKKNELRRKKIKGKRRKKRVRNIKITSALSIWNEMSEREREKMVFHPNAIKSNRRFNVSMVWRDKTKKLLRYL